MEGYASKVGDLSFNTLERTQDCETSEVLEEPVKLRTVAEGSSEMQSGQTSCDNTPGPCFPKLGKPGTIFLPVAVNGHSIAAVLDTGAQICVMSETLAQRLNVKTTQTIPIKGVDQESTIPARYCPAVYIKVGKCMYVCMYVCINGQL